MTNAIRSALENLYLINKQYEDFASKAPLGYSKEAEDKVDAFEERIDAAEEHVYNLVQMLKDEDEAFSIMSLMHQWYRIPRYLERHAA
ncbi:hypothetical protein ACR77U_13705 [Enterococcus faecium]|uniref:hypothetical protein n=1 Tax=Enterococcus faecium TaxID=1352 RepID=UPI003DA3E940